MNDTFLVSIADTQDKTVENVICENRDKFAELLMHLDTSKYYIYNVVILGRGVTKDISQFYIKEENLETGDKE